MESNRVYVGNLPYVLQWYELKDFMRAAGQVVHANILRSQNQRSRGCGIVEFATAEDAQRAIDTLNNAELKGRPIFVREDREPQHSSPSVNSNAPTETSNTASSKESLPSTPAAEFSPQSNSSFSGATSVQTSNSQPSATESEGCALFVGNLSFAVTREQLQQVFSSVGKVIRADIHLAPNRRSRGHGTVIVADEETAEAAISQFNGYTLDGRIIKVRKDKPSLKGSASFGWCTGHGEPSDVVYVANLPWTTTENDFGELVQMIGPVSKVRLQRYPDGRKTGCGVVQYEDASSAEQAISQLDNYTYGSCVLHVTYARYPPSDS